MQQVPAVVSPSLCVFCPVYMLLNLVVSEGPLGLHLHLIGTNTLCVCGGGDSGFC